MSDDPRTRVRRIVEQTQAQAGGSLKSLALLLEAQAVRAEMFGHTERAKLLREVARASA